MMNHVWRRTRVMLGTLNSYCSGENAAGITILFSCLKS